jgi:hypothetical protein
VRRFTLTVRFDRAVVRLLSDLLRVSIGAFDRAGHVRSVFLFWHHDLLVYCVPHTVYGDFNQHFRKVGAVAKVNGRNGTPAVPYDGSRTWQEKHAAH